MASYRLDIAATAESTLRKLPKADLARVALAIEALASDPRPAGCRKLKGHEDAYRIRVGVYRVIYTIDDRRIVVVVLKVGHRGQIYG